MKGLLPEALLRQLPRDEVYGNMNVIVNFHCKLDKKTILLKAHSASGEAVMEFSVQRPGSTEARVVADILVVLLCSKQERNPTQGLPPKLQVRCICLFVSIFGQCVNGQNMARRVRDNGKYDGALTGIAGCL